MGVEIVVIDNLKEVMGKIDETAFKRMIDAVNLVRNTTLETLSGARSGRIYKVPGTQRTYTASSPGEPPAVMTGQLRQSIKSGVEGEGSKVVGFVGTETKQGLWTEFGTKKMAARPWLRLSFQRAEAEIKQIFLRLWF